MTLSTEKEVKRVKITAPSSSNEVLIVSLQSKEVFKNQRQHFYVTQFLKRLRFGPGAIQLDVKKKHTSSLPKPYASNCTAGHSAPNMFSTIHTYESCIEICAYNHMYDECGDTSDIWKQKRKRKNHFFNNAKYISQEICIEEQLKQAIYKTAPDCTCTHACEETKYSVSFEFLTVNFTGGWYFEIRNIDPVTRVKIVPDYPLEEFLGALGGVIGLGARFMTALQLLIFLSICILCLFKR